MSIPFYNNQRGIGKANPGLRSDELYRDLEAQGRAHHRKPAFNGAVGETLAAAQGSAKKDPEEKKEKKEKKSFDSRPKLPGLDHITMIPPLILVIALQWRKVIGGMTTVLLLSAILGLAIRPFEPFIRFIRVSGPVAVVGFAIFYYVVTACVTGVFIMVSLTTCHHCNCTFTP